MERKMGTTILGIKGKKFVILASERQGTYGPIKFLDKRKILNVYRDIWIATSGMVADAIHLSKILSIEAKTYELERGYPPSVKALATLMSHYLYSGRFSFSPFMAAFILGGRDKEGYHLYHLGSYGEIMEIEKYIADGSGIFYALPILDAEYREDITEEEAIEMAIKAVRASIKRDIFSGRAVDVLVVNEKGSRFLEKVEIEKVIRNAGIGGNKE